MVDLTISKDLESSRYKMGFVVEMSFIFYHELHDDLFGFSGPDQVGPGYGVINRLE